MNASDNWKSFLGIGPSLWEIVSETRNPNPEIALEACKFIRNMIEEGRISPLRGYMKKFIEESCGS